MFIRPDHSDYSRFVQKWNAEKQPREIEFLGKRWQVAGDNDGPFFIEKGSSSGFDERYEQNSFHR